MFMQGPLRCVKRAEGAAGGLGSCLLSLLQWQEQRRGLASLRCGSLGSRSCTLVQATRALVPVEGRRDTMKLKSKEVLKFAC
jgi:hypothetical protein